MPCQDGAPVIETTAMADSDDTLKHDLECLRLASDCMQLASAVLSPALQSHLRSMARVWTALAGCEPDADAPTWH
jgi:hypothetical protein